MSLLLWGIVAGKLAYRFDLLGCCFVGFRFGFGFGYGRCQRRNYWRRQPPGELGFVPSIDIVRYIPSRTGTFGVPLFIVAAVHSKYSTCARSLGCCATGWSIRGVAKKKHTVPASCLWVPFLLASSFSSKGAAEKIYLFAIGATISSWRFWVCFICTTVGIFYTPRALQLGVVIILCHVTPWMLLLQQHNLIIQ